MVAAMSGDCGASHTWTGHRRSGDALQGGRRASDNTAGGGADQPFGSSRSAAERKVPSSAHAASPMRCNDRAVQALYLKAEVLGGPAPPSRGTSCAHLANNGSSIRTEPGSSQAACKGGTSKGSILQVCVDSDSRLPTHSCAVHTGNCARTILCSRQLMVSKCSKTAAALPRM